VGVVGSLLVPVSPAGGVAGCDWGGGGSLYGVVVCVDDIVIGSFGSLRGVVVVGIGAIGGVWIVGVGGGGRWGGSGVVLMVVSGVIDGGPVCGVVAGVLEGVTAVV
jgi:hypothetical protein